MPWPACIFQYGYQHWFAAFRLFSSPQHIRNTIPSLGNQRPDFLDTGNDGTRTLVKVELRAEFYRLPISGNGNFAAIGVAL